MSGFDNQKCPLTNAPGRLESPHAQLSPTGLQSLFSVFTMERKLSPVLFFKVTASTISLLLVSFKTIKCISVPLPCVQEGSLGKFLHCLLIPLFPKLFLVAVFPTVPEMLRITERRKIQFLPQRSSSSRGKGWRRNRNM